MTADIFLTLLLIVSIITGFITEGIKKLLQERGKKYYSNALAGCVAVVLSVLIWVAYAILIDAMITAKMIVFLIAFIIASWLVAMLGYDKVVQSFMQFKK